MEGLWDYLLQRITKSKGESPGGVHSMGAAFIRSDVEVVEEVSTVEVPVLVVGNLSKAGQLALRALVGSDEAIADNAANGRRQNVVVRVSAHGSYAEVRKIEAPVSKY